MTADSASDGASVLEVAALTKRFSGRVAVDDVSFAVRPGEIIGVLGPNGAGKSTLLHMLLGLIEPDAGEIRIFGRPLSGDRSATLSRINFASPYAALPVWLTVRENLAVYARIYGLRRPSELIEQLLEMFGVADLRDVLLSRLSSGQATRVRLCKALLNDPDLLLLDEPTAYLDPEISGRVIELLLQRRAQLGTTILYTSHNLTEVESLCDRILLLAQGRVAALGTPIEVTRTVLRESRPVPALVEAFRRVAKGAA